MLKFKSWYSFGTLFLISCFIIFGFTFQPGLKISKGNSIVLLGNNLCSRMMDFGYFETEMNLRYPAENLVIRNLCKPGDTPGFRPHPGRDTPWAFPGAEKFNPEFSQKTGSTGHFEYPDEWLTRLKTDIIIASFGFSESYAGPAGVENYKNELRAFIDHTLANKYNGTTAPTLALVSPIAFQDLSNQYDVPDGKAENKNLELYTEAMKTIANEKGVLFFDAFTPSKGWFDSGQELTIDGTQLNEKGYQKFSKLLVDKVFGSKVMVNRDREEKVRTAVLEKNWFWRNDYKIPNGVHVYGRRYNPFGNENYPEELIKVRQMTVNRDSLIWKTSNGEPYDLVLADSKTLQLSPIKTNYTLADQSRYLYGEEALSKFKMAPGFKIELFASEEDFPELANPVQITFDTKGRLWVAVMPTYPHYKPGDARPNDKLLILEDLDNDNKADKLTVFADKLHLPTGFELVPDAKGNMGVYISQVGDLKYFVDTDGDNIADKIETVLSGFDDHDSHHTIGAFTADPSGAIYMGEGVFLHSNVETAYGTIRGTNGGFFRYAPQLKKLERTAQLSIPNPWGIAFDDWGQNFFTHTSGPNVEWMMPGTIRPKYGFSSPESRDLVEEKHRVRPTSGLEFVSSSHFPDELQGHFMVNNTIGFLGTKVHSLNDESTGYSSKHSIDLVQSSDPNFRPVDMEFAPDGSLYIVDWHNVLVGHMQHNARDPLRDHVHGRIYRITYPAKPLVKPAKIDGASVQMLLDNLKLLEYRTRYRTKMELRTRNKPEVLEQIKIWTAALDKADKKYEHHLLEALWVSWGLDAVNQDLLNQLLNAKDFRARAAAVQVLRFVGHQVKNQKELLKKAAADEHGRVRLEAMVAASWLDSNFTQEIMDIIAKKPVDEWMKKQYDFILNNLKPTNIVAANKPVSTNRKSFLAGKEIYERDGSCATCHQLNGKGLPASGFPPLANTTWVTASQDRLIKIVLKGLIGPIEVAGKKYPGYVPMTPFESMLNDQEIADVLTYVRSSFGNNATPITKETVARVRKASKGKTGFYTVKEL